MRRTIGQTALVFTSALLLMALVGCGGSSKTTTAGGMDGGGGPGGMIPTQPTAPVTISGLPTGHTLESRTVDAGDSVTVFDSKGRRSVLTCPSGGEACVIVVAADRSATSTGGTPTVATTTNELIWQANNGPAGTSDGAHARGLIADLAGSDIGTQEIMRPAGTGAALSQSTIATEQDVVPSITWLHSTAPSKVELTLGFDQFGSLTVADDADLLGEDPGKLSLSSGTSPLTGWASYAGSKTVEGGLTLHGVVLTDIAAPEGGTSEVPARSVAQGVDLSGNSDLSTALSASTAPTSAVAIDVSSAIGSNVKLSLTTAALGTLRTDDPQNSPITVTVSYTDADGDTQRRTDATLTCAVATCRRAAGNLVGSWNIAFPKVDAVNGTQDANYRILGSWLSLPNNPSASAGYDMGAFADVVGYAHLRTELESHVGDNEYKGVATGLYVEGSYSPATDPTVRDATVGSFTATTELTADFGSAGGFTGVTGSVTGFMENGESLGDWVVSLRDTGDDTGVLFAGSTAGVANGRDLTGQWGVQFFQRAGHATLSGYGYAAGTFSAGTGSGAARQEALHIVGAFSAERQASN